MNSKIIREKVIIYLAEGIFNFDARMRFCKFIKPSDFILDVGALNSPLTKGLKNKVTAIDILPENNDFGFSEKTLKKLKSRSNITCLVMDAQNMSFDDNTFDIIFLTEVLEHIPDDKAAVAEIKRVLKPGGFLLFTVPNLERVPLEAGIKEHYRHYRKSDLLDLFGDQQIIFIKDRFKFNEFNWGSYFISRYNRTKNKHILLFLPLESMLKILLTFVWIPITEKWFRKKDGYNWIMVMRKK